MDQREDLNQRLQYFGQGFDVEDDPGEKEHRRQDAGKIKTEMIEKVTIDKDWFANL